MFQVTGRQMQMIFRDWLIMNVTAVSGNSLSGKWKVLVVAIILYSCLERKNFCEIVQGI